MKNYEVVHVDFEIEAGAYNYTTELAKDLAEFFLARRVEVKHVELAPEKRLVLQLQRIDPMSKANERMLAQKGKPMQTSGVKLPQIEGIGDGRK